MTSLYASVLAVVLVVLVPAQTVHAQPEPGDIGLFADEAGTQTTLISTPGELQSIYLVAFDVPHGIDELNLAITGLTTYQLFSSYHIEWLPPGAFWIWVCCPESWFVVQPSCEQRDGPRVLARIDLTSTEALPDDYPICVSGSNFSSFSPAVPQYDDCADQPRPFGIASNGEGRYPNGCLILNPTTQGPVHAADSTWGAIKTLYTR